MRLLVVDPSSAEREVTARALTSESHEVESVKDAAAAVGSLEKKRPDVILVESTMTGFTGTELVKRLQCGRRPVDTHIHRDDGLARRGRRFQVGIRSWV